MTPAFCLLLGRLHATEGSSFAQPCSYNRNTEVEEFLGNEEVRAAQTAGANTRGDATKSARFHAPPYP